MQIKKLLFYLTLLGILYLVVTLVLGHEYLAFLTEDIRNKLDEIMDVLEEGR